MCEIDCLVYIINIPIFFFSLFFFLKKKEKGEEKNKIKELIIT
jgi:hypothetical protein